MTKEEIKEVMKEMECWSCDNHLNICDKHTRREKEDKECGCRCHRESGWKPKQRGYLNDHQEWCDHCNPPEECKHYQFSNQPRNCDICKPEINTYTPKECEHNKGGRHSPGVDYGYVICTECGKRVYDLIKNKSLVDTPTSPSKKCKTSPHCSHNTNGRSFDKPCSVEWKPKDTPPSKECNCDRPIGIHAGNCNVWKTSKNAPIKVDFTKKTTEFDSPSKQPKNPRESICRKCGNSFQPRQGTYIVPIEYKEEICGECGFTNTEEYEWHNCQQRIREKDKAILAALREKL